MSSTPNNVQLDEEIKTFIKEYINSFAVWDLIVFFHHNPNVYDNPKNIAIKVGRSEEEVKTALEELASKKVLNLKDESSLVYSFEPPKPIQELTKKFVRLLSDRSARLQIVSQVLKQLQKKTKR